MHTWTEGDTLKAQLRTGVIGIPADSVASMSEVEALPPPALVESARPAVVSSGVSSAPAPAAPAKKAADPAAKGASGAPAAAGGGAVADEHVPDVPGEDALTKLERLDALSLKTHRELSVARNQGQPQETLDSLQRKIDDINEQREAAMRRLGQLR